LPNKFSEGIMSRRIITAQFQTTGSQVKIDTYFDRVVKYIPADIVGAWIAVTGLINSAVDIPRNVILWIAFVIGIVLTALWTLRRTNEPKKPPAVTQIIIATCAFIVWIFALGGPFVTLAFYRPVYGSLLLILYTFVTALIIPHEE
jgi:hypothetical protein